MKAINVAALLLIIIGGLNWGLVGLFNLDLIAAIFGGGSFLARLIYILVGLAAIYGFYLVKPLWRSESRHAHARH